MKIRVSWPGNYQGRRIKGKVFRYVSKERLSFHIAEGSKGDDVDIYLTEVPDDYKIKAEEG